MAERNASHKAGCTRLLTLRAIERLDVGGGVSPAFFCNSALQQRSATTLCNNALQQRSATTIGNKCKGALGRPGGT
jgi:hypothetical protein